MADNLKIVVGTKQEWEAGVLPPQADSITIPGSVQLYRPNLNFTRASTAYLPDGTQVASGLARYWRGRFQNLLTVNQSNGGEDGTTSNLGQNQCSVVPSTEAAKSGTRSFKIVANFNGGGVGPYMLSTSNGHIAITPGQTYSFSAYFKNGISNRRVRAGIEFYQAGGSSSGTWEGTTVVLNNVWQRVSVTIIAPANASSATLILYDSIGGAVNDYWYIDEIQFEEGTLTDWRLGGTGKAIMLQEGTTNLHGSNAFLDSDSNADGIVNGWSAYVSGSATGTRSIDTGIKTFGRVASQKIVRTSGVGASSDRWGMSYAVTSGVVSPNTISVLLNVTALDVGAVVRIYCDYSNSGATAITETLQTSITSITNGWITKTIPTSVNAATARYVLYIWIESGNGTVYVQAVQSENKTYNTSFIAGTRDAETVSIPTTKLSPNSGSIEFWWTPMQPASGIINQITSPRILQIGNYYTNGSLVLWAFHTNGNEPNLVLYVKGATNSGWSLLGQAIRATGSGWYVIGKPIKFVISWIDGNTFYVNVNGVEYGPYTITDTIAVWSSATMWCGSSEPNSPPNAYYDDLRISTIKRTAAESLAAYNSTTSLIADSNTLALYKFDDSLISEYPPITTVITKAIDLGSIHAAPLDLTVVGNIPNGTSAKLKRYRTSKDGINWNEWREINE